MFEDYTLLDEDKVFGFLGSNPKYKILLEKLVPIIRVYFSSPEIYLEVLEVFEEPEPPKLRVTIYEDLDSKVFLEKLKKVTFKFWEILEHEKIPLVECRLMISF